MAPRRGDFARRRGTDANCLVECADGDGDGFGDPGDPICTNGHSTDCDDGDSATYPGAPEINDGVDNQCSGDPGSGLVDEIAGNAGFHNPADKSEYSWPVQPGALSYEVARASSADFSTDCGTTVTTNSFVFATTEPPSGGVFYYLVRALTPNPGSWGANSADVERVNICP